MLLSRIHATGTTLRCRAKLAPSVTATTTNVFFTLATPTLLSSFDFDVVHVVVTKDTSHRQLTKRNNRYELVSRSRILGVLTKRDLRGLFGFTIEGSVVHRSLPNRLSAQFTHVDERRSSLCRLIDPLPIVVATATQFTRVLLPRVTRFVCRYEIPFSVIAIRRIEIGTSFVGSLFNFILAPPTIHHGRTMYAAVS